MMAYWAQLKPRERMLLIGGGVFIILLMLYSLLWDPLVKKADQLNNSIPAQMELVAWMEQAALEVQELKANKQEKPQIKGGQSMLAVIDRTAKQRRLSMKRVEPDGSTRVRVWLERASFDDLLLWIGSVQREYGIRIDSVVVDKEDEPGLVNARLTFEGASS